MVRRLIVMVVLALVVTLLVPGRTGADAAARIAGVDRFATAAAVSQGVVLPGALPVRVGLPSSALVEHDGAMRRTFLVLVAVLAPLPTDTNQAISPASGT